jgi:Cof subfamily protein (haloacid dehalogenase superfamily)
MTEYKALAIDLDGTMLVGEDLPEANLQAARRARDAGLKVFIATARWRQMAEHVAAQIGIEEPVIACSGAQVFDPTTRQDVFDERLPEDFTRELFDLCDATRCVATVTFSERVLLKLDGEPDRSQMREEMEWTPALTDAEPTRPRIAAIQGSKINAIIKEELAPHFRGRIQIYDSIGPNGKTIVTITGANASKGSALESACAHAGIDPAQVIAFGDAENDVEMFKVAGASVAMGQADEYTKSHASTVTLTNEEAGVAHAINAYLDTGKLCPIAT